MRHSLIFTTLLAIAHTTQVLGAAVTVFAVDAPTPLPDGPDIAPVSVEQKFTDVVSPIGTSTDSNGPVTAYQWKNIYSAMNLIYPSTTVPIVSIPVTRTYTIHQASATYALHGGDNTLRPDIQNPNLSLKDECKIDVEKGTGECVGEDVIAILAVPDNYVQTDDSPLSYVTTGTTTLQTTYTGTLRPIATLEVTSGAASVARVGGFAVILGLLPTLFMIM